jgi:hypothetical protein
MLAGTHRDNAPTRPSSEGGGEGLTNDRIGQGTQSPR